MKAKIILLFLLLAGCAASHVSERASFDFNCPESQIEVKRSRLSHTWYARGCGKRAAYIVTQTGPVLNSEIR